MVLTISKQWCSRWLVTGMIALLPGCSGEEDLAVQLDTTTEEPPGTTGDGTPTTGHEAFPVDESSSTTGVETDGETGMDTAVGSTTGDAGPECGDGIVGGEEQCDEGLDGNTYSGACLPGCVAAHCGDGFVQTGVDECDEGAGNNFDYGGCNAQTCKFNSRCGDGDVDAPKEVCDPGQPHWDDETVSCSNDCRFGGRIVFLTSVATSGDLGGIEEADTLCRTLAAGFDMDNAHSYRAWLSDATSSPLTRFEHGQKFVGKPYVLRSGVQIAADFDDLITNGPSRGIDLTDTDDVLSYKEVWTNTRVDGSADSKTDHCEGWTSKSFNIGTAIGLNSVAAAEWTDWKSSGQWTNEKPGSCKEARRLYCFEN